MYREHQFLKQTDGSSGDILRQEDRWRRMIAQWLAATNNCDSVILGDMNLDQLTWDTPENGHKNMIEVVKDSVETKGFYQVISGATRTWPGAQDSLLDHCWINLPEKVIQKYNICNAASDHNITGITIRIKGLVKISQEFMKRKWSTFTTEDYNKRLADIDWDHLYRQTDVNLALNFFEVSLNQVLTVIAPVIKVQPSGKFRNWLKSETKDLMSKRDIAREIAKTTNYPEDWKAFRALRNRVTAEIRRKKTENNYTRKSTRIVKRIEMCLNCTKPPKSKWGWMVSGPPNSLIDKNGKVLTAPQKVAEEQLNFFIDKNTKLLENIQENPDIDPPGDTRQSF